MYLGSSIFKHGFCYRFQRHLDSSELKVSKLQESSKLQDLGPFFQIELKRLTCGSTTWVSNIRKTERYIHVYIYMYIHI